MFQKESNPRKNKKFRRGFKHFPIKKLGLRKSAHRIEKRRVDSNSHLSFGVEVAFLTRVDKFPDKLFISIQVYLIEGVEQ
jgi:hypothetical protein